MTTMSFDRNGSAERLLSATPTLLSRMLGGVRKYRLRADAERQLEALDDRLLNDIGLKRGEIHRMVWGGRR